MNDDTYSQDPRFLEWVDSYQENPEHTIFILTELADRLEREDDHYLHNVDCLRAWLYQITKAYRNQLMAIGEEDLPSLPGGNS